MRLKQLIQDDDAVSPVIGVILMVAITVILASVIGVFVLGLGENVQSSAPSANFQFSYSAGNGGFSDTSVDGDSIEVNHNGGENFDATNLEIQVGNNRFTQLASGETGVDTTWPTTVQTGNKLKLTEASGVPAFEQGQDVKIIWNSPGGGSSSIVGSSQIP